TNQSPSPSDATDELVGALDRLGFGPDEQGLSADQIDLIACPFRDLVSDDNQVVCKVHEGLVQGTVEKMGYSRDDVSLTPFAKPGVCQVKLQGLLAHNTQLAKGQ